MRSITVVFVIPKFSGGGAEFVARQWMEYLAAQGDDVIAATTNWKPNEPRPDGIEIVDLGRGALASARRLRKLIRDVNPDVVMALMPHWNILALTATVGLKRRPRVIISGRNMATHLRGSFGMSYRVKQLLARRLYRRADEFIAISHPVAAEAIALYSLDPDKVSVVLNPSLKGEAVQRDRATAGDSPLAIVAPARLVHQKRPHLVIETAVACRESLGVNAEAHFFGVGPLSHEVERLALDRGVKVHMHGWVADWSTELPANAVVLLPSLSEGFGNVLVEAARAGVASVATSRALGVADAIVPGVTGVLVSGDSPSDFAQGVLEAASILPQNYEGWLSSFTRDASGAHLRSRLQSLVKPG